MHMIGNDVSAINLDQTEMVAIADMHKEISTLQ